MQLADHQRGRAAEIESEYPLAIGGVYLVLGMSIWENVFQFLVRSDLGAPCFAPAGFFRLFTDPIPQGWLFRLEAGVDASGRELWSEPGVAMWGYPELVEDPKHAAALEELEPEALAVFARHYRAADEIHDA